MGLFNKKKLSIEEILNAIASLSEEEKAQVKAKIDEPTESEMEEKENPEETSTEQVTEQPVEKPKTEGVGNELGEQPQGEMPEEESAEQPMENADNQPVGTETPPQTEELNDLEQENKEDVIRGLTDRLQVVEEKLAEFEKLKSLMEEYTKKQADSFGYKGAVPGAKKDIHEMSASELKQKMLNGEI